MKDHATDEVIEIRVSDVRQLFNAIDPSPFNDRDLDPGAVDFIVRWARLAPHNARLSLRVHLDGPAPDPEREKILGQAVSEYFSNRAAGARGRLRDLFRRGRISLAIGLCFLVTFPVLGEVIVTRFGRTGFGAIARESFAIGGWVAMWRPLELFLYDWWPIRSEARFYDRLAAMPVEIQSAR